MDDKKMTEMESALGDFVIRIAEGKAEQGAYQVLPELVKILIDERREHSKATRSMNF